MYFIYIRITVQLQQRKAIIVRARAYTKTSCWQISRCVRITVTRKRQSSIRSSGVTTREVVCGVDRLFFFFRFQVIPPRFSVQAAASANYFSFSRRLITTFNLSFMNDIRTAAQEHADVQRWQNKERKKKPRTKYSKFSRFVRLTNASSGTSF